MCILSRLTIFDRGKTLGNFPFQACVLPASEFLQFIEVGIGIGVEFVISQPRYRPLTLFVYFMLCLLASGTDPVAAGGSIPRSDRILYGTVNVDMDFSPHYSPLHRPSTFSFRSSDNRLLAWTPQAKSSAFLGLRLFFGIHSDIIGFFLIIP